MAAAAAAARKEGRSDRGDDDGNFETIFAAAIYKTILQLMLTLRTV